MINKSIVPIFDFDGTLVTDWKVDWGGLRDSIGLACKDLDMEEPELKLFQVLNVLAEREEWQKHEHVRQLIEEAELKAVGTEIIRKELVEIYLAYVYQARTAILTANFQKPVRRILLRNGLTAPQLLISRDSVSKLKPDPEGVHLIRGIFKVDLDALILIGDSGSDKEAAEAAGIRFLHVDELDSIREVLVHGQ